MGLASWVSRHEELQENAIKSIITGYVTYDSANKDVSLTDAASALTSKAKILVYLVALAGWRYVSDQDLPTAAKPIELAAKLGIKGSTLRSALKVLKDRKLIHNTKEGYTAAEGYSPRIANLEDIKSEIAASRSVRTKTRKRPARILEKKECSITIKIEPGPRRPLVD